jgi:hypothetical protein
MTALARYVRHAEVHGFDADFFEIAARDLDALDLGRLNLRLQRLEPKWKLSQDVARALALAIVTAGEDPASACRAAGCSRRTLNRALSDVPQVPDQATQPALQSGDIATIRPTLGVGSFGLDLSHSGGRSKPKYRRPSVTYELGAQCIRPNGLAKASYRSQAKARQVIVKRSGTDVPLWPYECPRCGLWHIYQPAAAGKRMTPPLTRCPSCDAVLLWSNGRLICATSSCPRWGRPA